MAFPFVAGTARRKFHPMGRSTESHKPFRVRRNQLLVGAPMAAPQSFDKFTSPPRSVRSFEQASASSARKRTAAAFPIWNGAKAACLPARGRMPLLCLILSGQLQPPKYLKRNRYLPEVKSCLNCTLGLEILAKPERHQTVHLGLG